MPSDALCGAWRRATGEVLGGSGREARVVVFVDTETTGLSASQLPFVLGALALDLDTGEMQLCQWALREREAELLMLRRFCEWLGERPVAALSSFNGASFDLPLLRRRMSRLGVAMPAILSKGAAHLDLLHLGRRLWRDRLLDCRLVTFEASRLGRRRQGDIPSSMIPAVFTDYLAQPGSVDARAQLERVEHHNRLDLWSLPELLVDFGATLSQPRGWGERARVARHYLELERETWARPVLETGLIAELRAAALGALRTDPALRVVALEAARLARSRGDLAYARELLSSLHRLAPSDPETCHRYAILLEHKAHDYPAALEVALASRDPDSRRIARLRDRCGRGPASAPQALVDDSFTSERARHRETMSDDAVSEGPVISSPRACVPRVSSTPGVGFA